MSTAQPATAKQLDPDALAALEEERDFLLRSIEDLEREHEAGDIDDDDFRELSDGYTVRTAEVLRAIAEHRTAFDSAARPSSPGRTFAVVAGILAIGILAGVLVSQASGRRGAGETATGAGAVPRSATQEARECVALTSANKIADAVACYQKVLDRDPKNPTALTYLGWTLVLTSGSLPTETGQQAFDTGKSFIDKAIRSDASFPDAYAFQAIVAQREGRPADAKVALDKLDTLDPPPDIASLTATLRDKVEQELPRRADVDHRARGCVHDAELRDDGAVRRLAGILVALAVLGSVAGCASEATSKVRPAQVPAWRAYKAEIEPVLTRVLGPTEGLADYCTVQRRLVPPPRFGIDLRPTLVACAAGAISEARQLAHRQIDRVSTNDTTAA